VVAEFEPAKALGRIRAGQPARLRLESYPWAQYGLVRAKVQSVASESRDGRVRVELGIEPEVPSGIVLEHGLPGELEVEVEKASPATLVLRSVGKLVEGA
jgi:membrane fusion protein (multidrug efflux system)